MKRRRPIIEPKKPVFFGCEGESEVGYGQVLNDFLREHNLPYFLHVKSLSPGAGDPLSRVQMALKYIAEQEAKRSRFFYKTIFIDDDTVQDQPRRAEAAVQLARRSRVEIVWQTPCYEAMLLRHLEGCTTRKPLDCRTAHANLLREWPNYVKPMSRAQLMEQITLDGMRQASNVELGLRSLLEVIELLPA